MPEPPFDSNKNYTKNTNNMINGTKVNKKLSLDDESDARKSWRTHLRNGMVAKSNRYRNLWRKGRKEAEDSKGEVSLNVVADEEKRDEPKDLDSSLDKLTSRNDKQDVEDNDITDETIVERIEKKKENREKKMSKLSETTSIVSKRSATKRTLSERRDGSPATDRVSFSSSQTNGKSNDTCALRRTKRQRVNKVLQPNM